MSIDLRKTTFHPRRVMDCSPDARHLLALIAVWSGCGGASASGADPQAAQPADPKLAASAVVICPEGSTYDPQRNVCVASSGVTPPAPPKKSTPTEGGSSSVTVKCRFSHGWVSVLPERLYPDEDEFLMQALIGFAEEPDFWRNESQYALLERYEAKPCSRTGQSFDLPAGAYFVLAGEQGTFARRGTYSKNGFRRRVRLAAGEQLNIDLSTADLTHTWSCISCPYVAFYHPAQGRYLPSFVVLAHRASRKRRGTDTVEVHDVPVHNGKIKLRVVEAELEITRLDQLVLEVDGQLVMPERGGDASALATADGIDVEMRQGTQITVQYAVPHVKGNAASVRVRAHGHYDPIAP